MVARVLSGAPGLLISGRSGPDWPSPLRSVPLVMAVAIRAVAHGEGLSGLPFCNSRQPPTAEHLSQHTMAGSANAPGDAQRRHVAAVKVRVAVVYVRTCTQYLRDRLNRTGSGI